MLNDIFEDAFENFNETERRKEVAISLLYPGRTVDELSAAEIETMFNIIEDIEIAENIEERNSQAGLPLKEIAKQAGIENWEAYE